MLTRSRVKFARSCSRTKLRPVKKVIVEFVIGNDSAITMMSHNLTSVDMFGILDIVLNEKGNDYSCCATDIFQNDLQISRLI